MQAVDLPADGECLLAVTPSYVIVGLTGGIAGGKSTVSGMLRDLGALLIDFDQLARKVVEPGTPGLEKIVDAFGEQILQLDGTLDRKRMSAIVFRDRAKRRKLEGLIHPDIRQAFDREVSRITKMNRDAIIVAEVPLLIEASLMHLFDLVVLVHTSRQVQLNRMIDRPGMTEQAAAEMLAAQLPIEEKKPYADHIIHNDGSRKSTRRQVQALWDALTDFQRKRSGGENGAAGDTG